MCDENVVVGVSLTSHHRCRGAISQADSTVKSVNVYSFRVSVSFKGKNNKRLQTS